MALIIFILILVFLLIGFFVWLFFRAKNWLGRAGYFFITISVPVLLSNDFIFNFFFNLLKRTREHTDIGAIPVEILIGTMQDMQGYDSRIKFLSYIFVVIGIGLLVVDRFMPKSSDSKFIAQEAIRESKKLTALSDFNLWIFQPINESLHSHKLSGKIKSEIKEKFPMIKTYPERGNRFNEYNKILFSEKGDREKLSIFNSDSPHGCVIIILEEGSSSSFSALGMIADDKYMASNSLILLHRSYEDKIAKETFYLRSMKLIEQRKGKCVFYDNYKEAMLEACNFANHKIDQYLKTAIKNKKLDMEEFICLSLYAKEPASKKEVKEQMKILFSKKIYSEAEFKSSWRHLTKEGLVETIPAKLLKNYKYKLKESHKNYLLGRSKEMRAIYSKLKIYTQP